MSALQTLWPATSDTDFADYSVAQRQRAQESKRDSPVTEDMSEWDQVNPLMTLITPCEPPKHSKWHMTSGLVVLTVAYVLVMAYVRWLTH